MANTAIDLKALLEAGAHFGHKTSRWHPAMKEYIHSRRGENYIIDLTKTAEKLGAALSDIEEIVAKGGNILFVGTKRQSKDVLKQTAVTLGMPYVTERWLGGMLTNQKTVAVRIKHLKDLESKMASGELLNKYSKLEVQRYQEEIDEMNVKFGGIKEMAKLPGVLFVVDVMEEINAVMEAKKLGIPVVALVDTNADPRLVSHPVPCNDDAVKTIELVTGYVAESVKAGIAKRKTETKA
jgi:small subunit ribosomal protein S2